MLVTMKEILDDAKKNGYGVTAPNVQSEDTVRAVLEVAQEYNAPMIVDVNSFIHPDLPWFVHMIRDLANQVKVPVAINLDHGKTYKDMVLGIQSGFTSIMVDRSSLPYEENVKQTKEVVKMCAPLGISVEAELGHVGMGDNYAVDGVSNLTVPEEAARFIEETGVDCLAVAIGTAHGRYKGTPHIDFERLEQIVKACGDTPLVLHGGSGTGDENLSKAVHCGIQKVNLATELIVTGKEELVKFFEDPNFDKWKLIPTFKKGYKDRLAHYVKLFNQADKAWTK
ncbi:class II fructose-bisphosphate aldolase [Faecalicoccus pleomorphus]|uniref:class II fructose-bisphosphate aldolase n=1 Tax=Faecalicoccus pleomorphus TaxID=1323 RepID=UPI00189B4E69|nr:class II fructose-bisphosphate aldolase [Faecalicoccus pleomorphus]MDB7984027.1 class II fructose-bisphosphate aldolase [Faecalicoccus pleomorphus]